jgi:hypothetical protein
MKFEGSGFYGIIIVADFVNFRSGRSKTGDVHNVGIMPHRCLFDNINFRTSGNGQTYPSTMLESRQLPLIQPIRFDSVLLMLMAGWNIFQAEYHSPCSLCGDEEVSPLGLDT